MLYSDLLRPLLFQCDPEWVHHRVLGLGKMLQHCPWVMSTPPHMPALEQTLFGVPFHSPVGLAAGFDKNLELATLMQALGFGFMEGGSISAKPWPGNSTPRLFRLPKDKAVINRMGLNNHGVAKILPRINALPLDFPVGINLVKTPDPAILGDTALADFEACFSAVYGLGTYLALNISCPNTEDGKTFEEPEALDTLLTRLRSVEANCQSQKPPRPWLLKVSPDLSPSQLAEVFDVGLKHQVSGWIATNTTASREGLNTPGDTLTRIGRGGLSGKPLKNRSTEILGQLHQLCKAHQTEAVLIGVGGVSDAESAWEKITHGASLVQVYTGLIYEGPGLIRQIRTGLARKLAENGLTHIQEAVGLAFR